jgi:hypothetical protein
MGMTMAAGRKGGRRRRGVPRYGAMADINMTPFIDIMLVRRYWRPASPSTCRRPKRGRSTSTKSRSRSPSTTRANCS